MSGACHSRVLRYFCLGLVRGSVISMRPYSSAGPMYILVAFNLEIDVGRV